MLRALHALIEVPVLGLVVYNLGVALWGWRPPPSAPPGERARRLRVVVPAHDEERVIAGLLSGLAAQEYPEELVDVWVVADRCTDGTAKVARGFGVSVAERSDGVGGKGAALSWYLGMHPLGSDEVLVVLDADNRVDPELLGRLADELDAGHDVLQAYLDVANPDASPVATASALSYWASNRMVQLARRNLGWTADLGGTGMCFTASSLETVGGFGTSLAEDQELGVRLFEKGIPVVWLHEVKIRDEKPSDAGVAVRQRARWIGGRRQVASRHLRRLLGMRTPAAWDLALRLVQPSRMGVALLSLALAGASALGAPLLPAWLWLGVAGIQVAAPLPFLLREGVPPRYLARYPLLILLPILKVPARLIRQEGWYHTPHSGK